MANMAAQLATKGPLGTALGQWLFIGFGTFVIFTGDNGVSKAAQDIAQTAFRLVSGRNATSLLREASLSQNTQPQQPIVIHNISPSSSESFRYGRYGWGMVIQLSLGAGACWGAYIVFSQVLPESVKELLPVTRKFFDNAVTSLGQGIIRVRDVLSEQISVLGLKQDELSDKLDDTHTEVLGLKGDIGDVRLNIEDISLAISRCEESLTDAAGRQTYMIRGVRLLVQCVGDLLRPSNPSVADELDQFSRLNEEMDGDFYYRDNGNPSRTPINKQSSRLEYPSSPNISEIGSVSANVADEIRPMSLPPSRSTQSSTTPQRSRSSNSAAACMISPSPFGQSPGPLVGKGSLLSMRSMPISRQGSCPENELPSDKGVSLDDVEQLLSNMRNSRTPVQT
ncbi:predicted protein [Thalassiosira pseudonana CCMP1335]|jgi:hypothetical protein|uniref:DUF1664 domain-containing protein n=1 Tax=Thalassiosira pseudonana TaxID=35128 RepID=B8C8I1_THAPS|nr:predicted protein [Thalassiosira pseudonana CCMP1335]EED90489.1 predicted protein [Thalassiosira pseudonana CCMP1335]|eukprot:scaffold14388_cov186-Alexandrium_tamarense.AAC.18